MLDRDIKNNEFIFHIKHIISIAEFILSLGVQNLDSNQIRIIFEKLSNQFVKNYIFDDHFYESISHEKSYSEAVIECKNLVSNVVIFLDQAGNSEKTVSEIKKSVSKLNEFIA